MTDNEYLSILLDGLAEHRNYFAEYLRRNAEIAKSKGIDSVEYYSRLNVANQRILDALIAQLHNHKGMFQFNNGEEHKPFTIEQMRVNLFQLTGNNKYTGQLSFEIYENINRAIEWESAMAEFLIRCDASLNEQKEKRKSRRKNLEVAFWIINPVIALAGIVFGVYAWHVNTKNDNGNKFTIKQMEKKIEMYKSLSFSRMDSLYKNDPSRDTDKK